MSDRMKFWQQSNSNFLDLSFSTLELGLNISSIQVPSMFFYQPPMSSCDLPVMSKDRWGSWLGFRIKGHDNMCQLIDLDACCHEKYHILSLIICFYVRPRHMCDCQIFWKSNILLTLIHAFPQRSSSSFHDDFVWGWTKISNIRRSTFKVPCLQILAS